MTLTIADVRAKFPEYGDMNDDQLAGALHQKFYADMPVADFRAKIGLTTGQPQADMPTPAVPQDVPTPDFAAQLAGMMVPPAPAPLQGQDLLMQMASPGPQAAPTQVRPMPRPPAAPQTDDPVIAALAEALGGVKPMTPQAPPAMPMNLDGKTPAFAPRQPAVQAPNAIMAQLIESMGAPAPVGPLPGPSPMDDRTAQFAREAVNRSQAGAGAGPDGIDPFANEGAASLLKRRGQQLVAGATGIIASVPEQAAIMGSQADSGRAASADTFAADRTITINDIRSKLAAGGLSVEEDAFLRQNLADLSEGNDALAAIANAPITPADQRPIFAEGDRLRAASGEFFGTPDPRDQGFWSQVAGGVGTTVGIGGAALGGSLVAGPAGGIIAGGSTGAAASSSQLYKEARETGADEETALKAANWGALIGTSDVLPIMHALKLIPAPMRAAVGGAFYRTFLHIAESAGEEAAQEYAQTVASNIVAQQLYDPERGWTEGASESALIGAITGGGLGAVGSVIQPSGDKEPPPEQPPVTPPTATTPPSAPEQPPARPAPEAAAPAPPPPANPMQDIAQAMQPEAAPTTAAPTAAPAQPAPAAGVTQAEVDANPGRYEVLPVEEGTGTDRQSTDQFAVIDNETGRILPLLPPVAAGGVAQVAPVTQPDPTPAPDPQADILAAMGGQATPAAAPSAPASASQTASKLNDLLGGEAPQTPQQAAAPAAPEVKRKPLAARVIKPDTAVTPTGTKIAVRYAITDLSNLTASNFPDGRINPTYPQDRQPRDRTDSRTQQQIHEIMQKFDPRQLDQSPTTGDGAMMVDKEGIIESGNGRAMMLNRVYAERPDLAQTYVDHLKAQGYPVDGIKRPVLVRIRDTDMTPDEIGAYTRDSNTDAKMAMNDTERAMADAQALPETALALYRGGDIDAAANADFVRAFLQNVVPPNEQGALRDKEGRMSQEAVRRISSSLLAKAYGDADLVSRLIEASDNNIKAIGGAVLDVAPFWAKMRASAASGAIAPEMDQTAALLEAVKLVNRARTEGRNVIEYVKQPDLLSGDGISPMGQRFLALMFKDVRQWTKPAGRDRMVEDLLDYVRIAMESAPGADMFGVSADPGKALEAIKGKQDARQPDQAADLFAKPPAGDGAGVRPEGGAGNRPEPESAGAKGGTERPAGRKPAEVKPDPAPRHLLQYVEQSGDMVRKYVRPNMTREDLAPMSGDKDVSRSDVLAYNDLMARLNDADTLDDKKAVADAWVQEQGEKHTEEFLVVLSKDGLMLSATRGTYSSVNTSRAVYAAAADGAVGYTVHNHPGGSAPSAPDISASSLFPSVSVMADGVRHTVIAGAYMRSVAALSDPDKFANIKSAMAGISTLAHKQIGDKVFAADGAISTARKAYTAFVNLALHRLGVIDYDGPAAAMLKDAGVDFDAEFATHRDGIVDWLRRGGFDVAALADRGGNRSDGRSNPSQPQGGKGKGDGVGKPAPDTQGGTEQQDLTAKPKAPRTPAQQALDRLYGKESSDVSSPGAGLEPDRGNAGPSDRLGAGDVPAAGRSDAGRGERGTGAGQPGDGQPNGGSGVPGGDAPAVGGAGNRGVQRPARAAGKSTGAGVGGRRNGGGTGGLPSERAGKGNASGDASGAAAAAAKRLNDLLGESPAGFSEERSTDSAAFKRWFGDSKVVDADGKPLVVYHGTDVEFDNFSDRGVRRRTMGASVGHYFTPDPEAASEHTDNYQGGKGENLIPAYLQIQNPLIFESKQVNRADVEKAIGRPIPDDLYPPDRGEVFWFFKNGAAYDGRETRLGDFMSKAAQDAGYDGVKFKEYLGRKTADVWVAFVPTQIKSIFNRGTWDATNPLMLAEDATGIDPRKYDAVRSILDDFLGDQDLSGLDPVDQFMAVMTPLQPNLTRKAMEALIPILERYLAERATGRTDPQSNKTPPIEQEDAAAKQAKADKIRVIPADADNIAATLPVLLPEQHGDVFKIETRFAKPDGHGMMITNGTGTGKTYTGMGVIKRFVQSGKKNILIVAPSDAVILGWTKTAEAMGVPVSQLRDTQDAGQGVTLTTYANLQQNNALANRQWDLVVTDEAQNLSSNAEGGSTGALENLRGIAHYGTAHKSRMIHAADWAKYDAMPAGEPRVQAHRRLMARQEADVAKFNAMPRSKVLFLSATPFAYDKSIDYAEGYLFNYPSSGRVRNSDQSGRNLFMVENFGYRIRYHKLTKPESAVDSAVFEREFHERLRREGVLSGRALQVDVDYDRKFSLVHDAVGTKLDAILEAISKGQSHPEADIKDGYQTISKLVQRNFVYHKRMQLLEAIKAQAAIPDIKKHLAMGRKVVVFHDFNVGGGTNPFVGLGISEDGNALKAMADLMTAHPDIEKLNFAGYPAPMEAIPAALGKRAAVFNGTVNKKNRAKALVDFNTDGSGVDVLVVQSDAGGAGISMHDLTGKHQRVLINLGMPVKPTSTLQEEGRILRVGTKTNAPFRYYTIGTNWERSAFARTIAERSGTAENLALGNQARAIREGFINAYMDAAEMEPSPEDGTGGKALDQRDNSLTPFQVAKTHYFGRLATSGRRDSREGVDFYPTPEPLAYKMVEWAGLRPNERVLEPSAGDGAIARYMPENVALTMVEPQSSLASRAQLRAPGGRVEQSTFEDYHLVNKHHVIIMNPPFGSGGKTAMEHVAKAAKHLRDGGRIVALIPTGPSADKRFHDWADSDAAKDMLWVADVVLPSVAFERSGTSVMTRVVILDKITDPALKEAARLANGGIGKRFNFTGADTISNFFDRLEDYGVPARPEPNTDAITELEQEGQSANDPVRAARPTAPLASTPGAFTDTTFTSQKGKVFPATRHAARVTEEVYAAMAATAKSHGGFYMRGARGEGPGFAFKTEADKKAFLDDMAKPTIGMEETAYHGTPHEFDQFSLDHIGSGEGAQVFGWGLYFASQRKVAEWYRDKLATGTDLVREGKVVEANSWETAIVRNILDDIAAGKDLEQSKAANLDQLEYRMKNAERYGDDREEIQEAIGIIQNFDPSVYEERKRGKIYTADVPSPDTMLDWDVRITEQPEAVRKVLSKRFKRKIESAQRAGLTVFKGDFDNMTGQRLYSTLSEIAFNKENRRTGGFFRNVTIFDRGTSDDLRAAGIPGLRYLDGSSRGGADGSHNYVIFDESQIQIIAREQRQRAETAEAIRQARAGWADVTAQMPALRAELDRLDLKRVDLRTDPDAEYQGMIWGTQQGYLQVVIGASMDPKATLYHEVIHALRMMNLFTDQEWQALNMAAVKQGWLEKHDIAARYPNLNLAERIEEAIAEEFSAAMVSKTAPKGSILIRAFNKIARALKAFRNVLTGQGYQSAEAIFGKVMAGEISGRRSVGMDQTASMQAKRDADTGDMFAAPAADKPSGMTAAQRREMEVRAAQSKMRKTGGNSGDAGPLFDDQTDLFGDRKGFFETPDIKDQVDELAAGLKGEFGLRDLSLFVTGQNDLKLNMFAVDKAEQGQGIGTAVMGQIVAFADANRMRITLTPGQRDDGFGTTSRTRLVSFYKRFGFVENKGRNKDFALSDGMFRNPAIPASARFQAKPLRPLTKQGRAHRNSGMGGAIFIPDRRVWEILTDSTKSIWQRLRETPGAMSDAIDRARLVVQDRMLPILRAQEAVERATGKPVTKEQDAYIAETTFSGKVGRHLFEIDENYTKPIIQIIADSKKRMTSDSVGEWLYARHAQERNAHIASINPSMPDGGSGMTDADAQAILAAVAASPDAGSYLQIGALVDDMRERALTLRENAGLIKHTEAAQWRRQYKYYVPLKGFDETDHSEATLDVAGVGRRFTTRGAESKRALGRGSEAFNPLQSAITQAQEASIRAEKNRVGNALYELAKDNPSDALWSIKKPAQKRVFNRTTGLVETRVEDPISLMLEPNEMAVKVNGEEVRILFHDERLARSVGNVGADQMNGLVRALSIGARVFSMARTMLNPEFMLTNAFRDFQTAQFNIQAFGDGDKARIAAGMAKNWRKALAGAWRGQTNKADTEWSRHFKEFQQAGAQVSFWTMENPTAARADLDKRINLARGNRAVRTLKVLTSPSAFFSMRDNAVLDFIERANLAVDNAIRLAAFVEARKAGWDVGKAAFLAKELTVNFNRRGETGSTINALYPFFNAAIQGSVRTVKALTSRRVAIMCMMAVVAGGANDLLNASLSDADVNGELFYDKAPEYQSQRNIQMVLWGTGENMGAVPMPYGYNVFPYMGQQLGKIVRGVKTPEQAFADVAGAMFGAFSPISGGTPATLAAPWFVDPMVELGANENFFGSPIFPRYPKAGTPDAFNHYDSATQVSQEVAQALNMLTGGNKWESGAVDISPETLDYLAAFTVGSAGAFWGRTYDDMAKLLSGQGDQITRRDIPFVRTFATSLSPYVDQERFYDFKAVVARAHGAAKGAALDGTQISARTKALAGLHQDVLDAENEIQGQTKWNQKKPGALAQRPRDVVYLEFNKKFLDVMRQFQ